MLIGRMTDQLMDGWMDRHTDRQIESPALSPPYISQTMLLGVNFQL